MADPRQFPNQFSAVVTSTGEGIDFGFGASRLRLVNDGGVPAYFSLTSTTPSTGDARVQPLEEFNEPVPNTHGMALATTSTAGMSVRVLALGGE